MVIITTLKTKQNLDSGCCDTWTQQNKRENHKSPTNRGRMAVAKESKDITNSKRYLGCNPKITGAPHERHWH